MEALNRSETDLKQQLSNAERRASIDGLTHLWNHASIVKLLQSEASRAARIHETVAVAMVDVDHFKNINDSHGHLVGDEVLAGVAERIRRSVRSYDSVGRYGGEEFLVLLVAPHNDTPFETCDRIRRQIECAPIEHSRGEVDVTVSIGVCATRDAADVRSLIEAADRALYTAKQEGRNRVVAREVLAPARIERGIQ